ncbi:MAG: hypothetical protein WDO71_19720 [Bacteroidota bacterium]
MMKFKHQLCKLLPQTLGQGDPNAQNRKEVFAKDNHIRESAKAQRFLHVAPLRE